MVGNISCEKKLRFTDGNRSLTNDIYTCGLHCPYYHIKKVKDILTVKDKGNIPH